MKKRGLESYVARYQISEAEQKEGMRVNRESKCNIIKFVCLYDPKFQSFASVTTLSKLLIVVVG